MCSDLGKHEDTRDHAGIQLGMGLMAIGQLDKPHEMREFILGFN